MYNPRNNFSKTHYIAVTLVAMTSLLVAPASALAQDNGDIPPPNIDTNDDGTADAWDVNNDGKPDIWDTDGNGQPDAWDKDGDNKPDVFDKDGDGRPDSESSSG